MNHYGIFENVFPIRGPRRVKRPKFIHGYHGGEVGKVHPAGQAVNWQPAGTASAGIAFSADEHYSVSTDASGNPIRGTVVNNDTNQGVADSFWAAGTSGGTPSGGQGVSARDVTNIIDTTLTQGLSAATSIFQSANATQQQEIRARAAEQIQALQNQANIATQQGNTQQANAAREQMQQLMMFQSQMGQSSSSTIITAVLIAAALGVAGFLAYKAMSPSTTTVVSSRRVRANPSKRRSKRSKRRHRRSRR